MNIDKGLKHLVNIDMLCGELQHSGYEEALTLSREVRKAMDFLHKIRRPLEEFTYGCEVELLDCQVDKRSWDKVWMYEKDVHSHSPKDIPLKPGTRGIFIGFDHSDEGGLNTRGSVVWNGALRPVNVDMETVRPIGWPQRF